MWIEILRAVGESFRGNRLRFVLTLLGLVVGSSSLVLLSGLLEGGREALLLASQRAAEDDLVEIRSSGTFRKDARRTTRPLERADVQALEDSPLLGDADVLGQRSTKDTLQWQGKKKYVTLVGAEPAAASIYRLELAQGRFLGDGDLADRRRVAVVGHKVWTELFAANPDLSALEVRTRGERFLVVGVLAHKPSLGGEGPWMWDNRILLPQTTFDLALPRSASGGASGGGPGGTAAMSSRQVDTVFVRLSGLGYLAERIVQVRAAAKSLLLRRHYGVENFRIAGEREEDAKGELIINIISLLILATAVVSLVVGGINVMNIMLVSVTERTREIGIRRACGAPRSAVLWQFLAESAATASLGGLVGVACGVGLTALAARILDKVLGGWTFHLVPWAPPLALGAALFVGVAFGLYPAWRAARLDPVEALRFE